MRIFMLFLAIIAMHGADVDLISQLVSSNPKTKGDWNEELPKEWSEKEAERVENTYMEIVKRGKQIVPSLIVNLDRKEFSMTISTSVPYTPLSVGEVCHMAISSIYDRVGVRYKARHIGQKTLMGYSYFDYLHSQQIEIWWTLAKDMEVKDVQEKIKQWYIDREREFGFESKENELRILNEIDRRYDRQ